jgi:hypothetical protein
MEQSRKMLLEQMVRFPIYGESGATTQNRTNLAPGNYTCLVSDQLGCSTFANYTITESTGNIQLLSVNTLSEQCGNNQGSINITTAGTGLSYQWSNGAISEDISGLSAGNYSCIITNDQGCSLSTGTIYVGNSNGGIIVSTISNTPEICNQSNGAIDINVIGGTSPYLFSWSNGANSEDISNLSNGVYTVTITDLNGCVKSQSFTINDNPGTLAIDNAILSNNFCGTTTAAIDLTTLGGTSPLNFSWSTGESTEDLTDLSGGTYTVTITDASNCIVSQTFEIQNTFIANGSITNENCGQGNGAVNLLLVGGESPFNFNWSNGANTQNVSNLLAGTYNVTITDNNGCEVIKSFNIQNQVGNLTVSGSVTDENCGQGNGAINITTSGGNNPLSFMWNNGITTEDLTNLSAGNYSIVVTDLFGCSVNFSSSVANLTNGLSLSLNSKQDENCGQGNGSIDITTNGSGIISYLWSNGIQTEDAINLNAGTFTLTATDDLGCETSITEIIVNQTGSLAITFTNIQNPLCGNNNGFIDIEVSGTSPISYVWSNGQNTQDNVALSANNYTVQLTDGDGCVLTQSFDLNSISTPITSTAIVTDANCVQNSGAINLTVTSGIAPYQFSWSNGSQQEDQSNLAEGNYSVIITDAFGCSSDSNFSVGSSNNADIQLFDLFIQDDFCSTNQGGVFVNASGVNRYYVNGVEDFNFGNIFGLSAGAYTITLEDFNGCSLDTVISIGNQANFTVTSDIIDETCGAGNGNINITPNDIFGQGLFFTYLWNTGSTNQDINNLNAGTYTVRVSDNFGCVVNSSYTVNNQTGTFTISNSIITPSNCGTASGGINITVSGGQSPYTYSWSNGASSEDISGLIPGNYTVTIADASACSLTQTYTITNSFELTASITNASCNQSNGAINITTTGGQNPNTYLWSNGATTEDINGLNAGTYSLTVTDNLGCSLTQSFIIEENPSLQLFGLFIQDDFCSTNQGGVFVNASGVNRYYVNGVEDFNFGNIFGLSAGAYTITLEDFNGCSLDTVISIGNQANFTVTSDIIDETCGAGNGNINITPNDIFGQGLFFTYLWNTGSTNQDINNLNAGTYTVRVSDNFGCVVNSSYTVNNQTGTFTISNSIITPSNCGTASGGINITVSGGQSPYTYSWSNGASSEDVSGLIPGNYTVTIADASACSLTQTYTITNSFELTASITNASCNQSNGAINITTTGGQNPNTYLWSNGATTEDINGLNAGTYSLTVTDNLGCSLTQSYYVNQNSDVNVQFIQIEQDYCGQGFGQIFIQANGVQNFYINGTLDFNFGEFFDLTAGSYTISMESFLGCTLDTVLVVPNSMTFTPSFVVTNEFCGNQSGAINMTVNDDFQLFAPFYYQWSNGQTTEDLNGLSANTYTVQITHDLMNDFGFICINSYDVIVMNQTGTFAITNSVVQDETCQQSNGLVDITINGGVAPITYLWSNGASSEDISNLSNGNYSVNITDNTGCSISNTYTINDVSPIAFQAINIENDNCNTASGSIEVQTSGNVTELKLNGDLQSSNLISNLSQGIYTISISNGEGCNIDSVLTIQSVASFDASGIAINETCLNNNGSIDVTIDSLGQTDLLLNYLWNNGASTQDLNNLSKGSYSLTIINNDGCQLIKNFELDSLFMLFDVPELESIKKASCFTCNDGNINMAIPIIEDFQTYSWNNGIVGLSNKNILPGNYILTITNQMGCDTTMLFSVGYNPNAEIIFSVNPNPAIDNFQVTVSFPNGEKGKLVMYDYIGQIVYESPELSSAIINFDTYEYSAATYFFTARSSSVFERLKFQILK